MRFLCIGLLFNNCAIQVFVSIRLLQRDYVYTAGSGVHCGASAGLTLYIDPCDGRNHGSVRVSRRTEVVPAVLQRDVHHLERAAGDDVEAWVALRVYARVVVREEGDGFGLAGRFRTLDIDPGVLLGDQDSLRGSRKLIYI